MFLSFCGDRFAILVQSLFEQVVFHIQLLLSCYVHGINTEVWMSKTTSVLGLLYILSYLSGELVGMMQSHFCLLPTGTGHVREYDVDVDFQFVSPWCVHKQLRVDLWRVWRHIGYTGNKVTSPLRLLWLMIRCRQLRCTTQKLHLCILARDM